MISWFTPFIKAVGGIVTTRTSIFTPLLTLNTIVIGFSGLVYWKSNNLWVFTPAMILLTYSIYRHECYARQMPHMLSTEKIQRYGMDLHNMGNSRSIQTETTIDAMQPVKNPEIDSGIVVHPSEVIDTEEINGA